MANPNKFQIQDSQYEFPYHYIPHFTNDGTPSLLRKLNWGFDYLCYQKHLHEKVVFMMPQSVLEVGCGDGYFLGGLPTSIPVRVGVDLSSKAIAFAKAFHPDCIFYNQDISALVDTFDIIVAIEVIEHIPEEALPGFFHALYERVNNNGKIVISVPTTVIPLNKKHYRHYTIELFKRQLKQSGVDLVILQKEYIFSKPWWLNIFKRFFDNRLFSLEIKPLMHIAWKQVCNKYRIAKKQTGFHLVIVLEKVNK